MTDPTHDPQAELDELASAYLDGQTSYEEAWRVIGDPVLLARVERLRQVRDAVRMPDLPADPVRREAAIAAALFVAGHEPITAPVPVVHELVVAAGHEPLVEPLPLVDDVAAVRARRSSRRRWLPLAGVAAAIALAALLIPQLGDDGGRTDTVASKGGTFEQRVDDPSRESVDAADPGEAGDSSATADAGAAFGGPTKTGSAGPEGSEGTGPVTGGGGVGAGTTGGDPGSTTTTTAPQSYTTLATPAGHLVDLGSFDDGDAEQLTAAAKTAAEDPAATSSVKPNVDRTAVDKCLSPMEAAAADEGASVLYGAVAEVGDETVVGIAVERDGARSLQVQYVDGCTPWFDAPL